MNEDYDFSLSFFHFLILSQFQTKQANKQNRKCANISGKSDQQNKEALDKYSYSLTKQAQVMYFKTAKLLRVMQLTAIILLTTCLAASAAGHTQGVTLKLKDAPLEKVFSEIRKQTGYNFLFSSKELKEAGKVTVQVNSATVEQVLSICFKNKPFTWVIENNTIVVKRDAGETKQSPNANGGSEELPPPIDITGKVTDENGNPLSGATIKVKGSSKGTTTNNDGVFVLKGVDEDATLEISFVGYETYAVAVNSKSTIVASLKIKPESLNEVVINKGYYTEKQRATVGNVGHLDSKDIEKQPVNNPLLALQGRVPGLVITQESGITGGPVTIRVQGINSIAKGNDPLIVIDGVPYPSTVAAGLGNALGNSSLPSGPSALNFINPSDIESIDILKDADATAIYGSRAANGAILITTKKGKVGQTKMDINLQQGWGNVASKLQMLNTRQYLDMRYEGLANDGNSLSSVTDNDLTLWDTTRYTDWQKTLIGNTARFTNINAIVSGGTAAFQYVLGGTYQRQTTVFPGNFADQRGNVHFVLNNVSANQRFHLQFSGNYMMDENHLPGNDLTQTAILLEPVAPALYNNGGSLNWAPDASGNSSWDNPLVDMLRRYKNNTSNLISNLQTSYMLFTGLELKASIGYTKLLTNDFVSTPLFAIKPENRNVSPSPRNAGYGFRDVHSWIAEPQLNYQRQISEGKLDALIGASIQQSTNKATNMIGSGYTSDEALENTGAAVSLRSSTSFSQYRYNGVFGRVNYSWAKKYILNVNARRDGSSRFGDKNKFHNFGSVGLAWIFSQEAFINKNFAFLSFGKLRASYGTTGNDQIGDYAYLNLYGTVSGAVPYQSNTGLRPNGLPNPYIGWEETRKWQGGLDIGFFNDKILLAATYARNRSSNQLLPYALPSTTGFVSVTNNFPATVQNTSWEFALNTVNIRAKKLLWTTGLNLTIPRNKVLEFPNIDQTPYASGDIGVIVGQPLGVIKAFHFLGVEPTTGQYVVADSHGTPTTTPDYSKDATVLINKLPKIYGGLQNTLEYNGFQLDFLFQFVKQTGSPVLFNNGSFLNPGEFFAGLSNQPVTVLHHWQNVGDIAPIQRYSSNLFTQYDPLSSVQGSDANYTDASFIRLKNASLSYTFPEKITRNIHLQNLRIYVRGQNLLILTKYKGLDPENQSTAVLPPLKLITIGLMVTVL